MRVILVSTYELGHQPWHLASPAAELVAAGHQVRVVDLAVERWDPSWLAEAEAMAISVPMHTALRLAIEVARRARSTHPELPLAFYGLYAGVGATGVTGELVDRLIVGEYEDQLLAWLAELEEGRRQRRLVVELAPRRFRPPRRDLLAPLARYAHLVTGEERRLAAYTEASRGCRHRCAHCPVPAVYDGRFRITGVSTVLADVAAQVEAGATHITFGDPDFLNAPPYALKVLEAVHASFDHLTFDVTVKVSHLLEQEELLGRLAELGVIFVTSAFETLDDNVLALLGKGHTSADARRALAATRSAGIDLHPTWLPFTPWTTAESVVAIARFIWEEGLAAVTEPVQLSIRLLVPDGSLMLGVEGFSRYLTGYDPAALGYTWRSEDPGMDRLQAELATLAASAATGGESGLETLAEMTALIGRWCGVDIPTDPGRAVARPRLSEPWFCCAEPTGAQLGLLD